MDVKQRLQHVLKLKGETVNSFASKTGILQRTLSRQVNEGTTLSYDVIKLVLDYYPDISPEWLVMGEGSEYKTDEEINGIALYDANGAAGHESFDTMLTKDKVIGRFVVPSFSSADWMIYVRGSSMYPKFSSGDIIACREIKESKFIQWNKVYVVATREQGLLVKRLMPSDEEGCIKAVSENTDYPPFDIPKDEIFGLALVLGAIKLE